MQMTILLLGTGKSNIMEILCVLSLIYSPYYICTKKSKKNMQKKRSVNNVSFYHEY
jgi:hypothetical protein